MIFAEDARTGDGCNALQRQVRASWSLMDYNLRTRKPRRMTAIAIWGRDGQPLRIEQPVVPGPKVDFAAVVDNRVRCGSKTVLEIAANIIRPRMVKFGQILVGDEHQLMPYGGDLSYLPADGCQPSRNIHAPMELVNHWPGGVYRIRKLGGFLDLCIGELPNGKPAVQYRLRLEDVLGPSPCIRVFPEEIVPGGRLLPSLAQGQVEEIGPVMPGDVLAFRDHETRIWQAAGERGPVVTPAPPQHLALFNNATRLLSELNYRMALDSSSLGGRQPPDLTAIPEVMLEFAPRGLVRLVRDPAFMPTHPVLVHQLLESLRPGSSRPPLLLSHVAGTVQSVTRVEGDWSIVCKDHEFRVPGVCQINIDPGQHLSLGQAIGQYPRGDFTFDSLTQLLGIKHMSSLVLNFLFAVSEPRGEHRLLHYKYVPGMTRHAIKGHSNRIFWHLDLRPVMHWYDPRLKAIMLPSVAFGPQQTQLDMGFLTFVLRPDPQPEPAEKQPGNAPSPVGEAEVDPVLA